MVELPTKAAALTNRLICQKHSKQ
jgi:hypothetical protein